MTAFADITSSTDLALSNAVIRPGFIIAYPSATPPSAGWLLCDGAPVSSTTYADLAAALNGAFNTAAGLAAPPAGTFRTPPLVKSGATNSAAAGRIPVGILAGTDTIAASGGAWGHGHGIGDLGVPGHTHSSYGPDGQMRCSHSHTWNPSVYAHTHFTSYYWTVYYGPYYSQTWVSGSVMQGVTSTIYPNNGTGVYGAAALIYGNSGGAGGWGLGGNLTDPQDGPYTGIYWYIKT